MIKLTNILSETEYYMSHVKKDKKKVKEADEKPKKTKKTSIAEKVKKIEDYFAKNLKKFDKLDKVVETRYIGAICAIEVEADWEKIKLMRQEFVSKGVFLRPFANVIYVMPSLTISTKELDKIFKTISEVIKNVLR